MYREIYANMTDAGIARTLDTPVLMNENGEDALGLPCEYEMVHPVLLIF
jgi:hypothetical protein